MSYLAQSKHTDINLFFFFFFLFNPASAGQAVPKSAVGASQPGDASAASQTQSWPTGHGNKEPQSRSRGAGSAPLAGRARGGELLAGAHGKDEPQTRRVAAKRSRRDFHFELCLVQLLNAT